MSEYLSKEPMMLTVKEAITALQKHYNPYPLTVEECQKIVNLLVYLAEDDFDDNGGAPIDDE